MRAPMNVVVFVLGLAAGATAGANALPDPTRPPDFAVSGKRAASSGPARPVLRSTLVSPERKSAVISGKRVRVGDTFQGAVITDISAYEVRMSKGGRETTLRLLPKLSKEQGTVE